MADVSGPQGGQQRDAARWLALARRGDLGAAWAVSDRIRARTRVFGDPSRPRHEQVLWDGTSVDGRHVLVRCYHGLGDTIQFARYLPPLRARAAQVTVWAPAVILPLLQTMPIDVRWLPLHDGAAGVTADVDLEIMELAYLFRSTLDSIPCVIPYLHVPHDEVASSLRPRVGLVWRGGRWDGARSIPLTELESLLEERRVDWYDLQHDAAPSERHPHLARLPTEGLLTTAMSMRRLDLLITVDSMPAHLAGALGLPTWTLLRRHADWRWMERRSDSPWYPTMRLFRQRTEGRWSDVLAAVRRALSQEYVR